MRETLTKTSMDINTSLEEKIKQIGKEIFNGVRNSKTSFFDRSFWSTKLMEIGMKNEKLKVELFRFVDVLPTLYSDDQLARHIQEYFSNFKGENSELIKIATDISSGSFIGKMAAGVAVRTGVTQMARTFIAGANVKEVIDIVGISHGKSLRKKKMAFTVDI